MSFCFVSGSILERRATSLEVLGGICGRVSDALLRGGADDDRRAVGYIGVLEKISTIRAAVVPPDAALLNKMSVLRLRHETRTLPTVGDLRAAGGEVTVDMGPPLEACVDNEVDD